MFAGTKSVIMEAEPKAKNSFVQPYLVWRLSGRRENRTSLQKNYIFLESDHMTPKVVHY